MLSANNSYLEIEENGTDIAVLASGATEQCGPYLPLSVDTACADYYAKAWAKALNAYIVPTLPFNTSEEHAGKKGTITLSPTLMMAIFEEIILCLSRQGFRKFILTGGHGGAYWVGAFIKHINYKFPDIILINAHAGCDQAWQSGLAAAGLQGCTDVHGGLLSACLTAFLLDTGQTHIPSHGVAVREEWKDYWDYVGWESFTENTGSMGKLDQDMPVNLLREKGRLLMETFVSEQSENLKDHFAMACTLKKIN